MKKAIFILLIIFCSCSGTKKLEKSSLKSDIAAETNVTKKTDEKQAATINDQSIKNMDKKTDSSETKSKVTETKTTKFDPSKPIVPGTGKPPVIEETTKIETESNQKDIKIQETLTDKLNIQISLTKELQQKIDSIQKINKSLSSKTENKETPVMSWWKFIIIGFVIGLFAMFFIRKIPFIAIWIKIKSWINRK